MTSKKEQPLILRYSGAVRSPSRGTFALIAQLPDSSEYLAVSTTVMEDEIAHREAEREERPVPAAFLTREEILNGRESNLHQAEKNTPKIKFSTKKLKEVCNKAMGTDPKLDLAPGCKHSADSPPRPVWTFPIGI